MKSYITQYRMRMAIIAIALLPLLCYKLPVLIAVPALVGLVMIYNRMDKGVTAIYTISRHLRNERETTKRA